MAVGVLLSGSLLALHETIAQEVLSPAQAEFKRIRLKRTEPQVEVEVQLEEPQPASVVESGAVVEKVSGGYRFTEGPVWHPDGFLLFSDIPANIIYKWIPTSVQQGEDRKADPQNNNTIFRQPSGNSNGLALDVDGRLIACEHGNRRVSRTAKDGTIETLAATYNGKKLNSPNDLAVKSDRSIYFTDPPYGLRNQQQGKELAFNGVYRVAPDGALSLLDDTFERPNGIAFSPDEKTLYVNDSERRHIRAFDVQENGTLANGRVFAELNDANARGVPDGMKVDKNGNVFSTGPGGVWVFAPNGKLLHRISTPEVTTNLGWGDTDGKTLYITASTSVYRIRVNTGGF